jgi:hypothetical protein
VGPVDGTWLTRDGNEELYVTGRRRLAADHLTNHPGKNFGPELSRTSEPGGVARDRDASLGGRRPASLQGLSDRTPSETEGSIRQTLTANGVREDACQEGTDDHIRQGAERTFPVLGRPVFPRASPVRRVRAPSKSGLRHHPLPRRPFFTVACWPAVTAPRPRDGRPLAVRRIATQSAT